jgi:hypothetical protein
VAAGADETGLAEVGQVSRRRGLGDPEDCDEVTNAELTIAQDVQDPQARPVGKGPEELVDEVEVHSAIFDDPNIWGKRSSRADAPFRVDRDDAQI